MTCKLGGLEIVEILLENPLAMLHFRLDDIIFLMCKKHLDGNATI